MNTLNVDTNHLSSISINKQLSFRFSDDKQAASQIDISEMTSGVIEKNCLHCFYAEYLALGGEKLPKDVVNMIIQKITMPQNILRQKSINKTIILHISKQISAMQIKQKREIWRLSNIVTKQEYGFSVSYTKWFFQQFF